MSLSGIIARRIREEGPISFRDFMEMALYYPELGYYATTRDKIGPNGDYYTTPFITNLFGEILARQIEEMWRLLGNKEFTIVEYGAGHGSLCHQILNYISTNTEFYKQVRYCIIEKSPAMRWKEQAVLHEKVTWHESVNCIPGFSGCVLSNELVDNFAVHQVVMDNELMEVFVHYDDGFREVLLPASQQLKEYFEELNIVLPKGFRTEVNLQAKEWLCEISQSMKEGFMITVDYGMPSSELYHAKRSAGTIACYHQHQVNNDPYWNIGDQDITAHVNFSALHTWGTKYGLRSCGYTNQAKFLHAMGLVNHIRKIEQEGREITHAKMSRINMIHNLLMDMGRKFKVLIQEKCSQPSTLSGMLFSDPIY